MTKNWPSMSNEGILGTPPIVTKQSFEIRQNEKIYRAFSTLIKNKHLWVSIDRYGLFRPTVDVEINGEKTEMPQWSTWKNVHFDTNPWVYYSEQGYTDKYAFPSKYNDLSVFCSEYNAAGNINEVKVQGVVNFLDNKVEDGGFQIVPAFNRYRKEWIEATRKSYGKKHPASSTFIVVNDTNLLSKAKRVPLRAGCLLLWDGCMPHGSAPNFSSKIRMVQFLKFFPSPTTFKPFMQERKKVVSELIQECKVELTPLGEKLLGLKLWEDHHQ
eukprot:TRINITY_DN2583_c0_g1_i1.p1 TRINITY_DN2583_c0_g1~~TRINITY_DN2583_c0_g1_i1.p1  ORF type:complete len:270 (-),score=58.62 TRINITY_DN2583_c0_g1_i1:220-1029(-)